MAQQTWWQRVLARIDATYERRIRAASLVTEYGADHHGHHADHAHDEPHPAEADDAGGAVIANVPRGTRLSRDHAHSDSSDGPSTAG